MGLTFSGCPRFSAARDVFDVLRQVEAREVYETAHRIRSIIGQVFTIAIDIHVSGVTSNPAVGLARVLNEAGENAHGCDHLSEGAWLVTAGYRSVSRIICG